jgi:hypothetical protein
MARGLSELQKTMLAMSAEKKDDPEQKDRVLYSEVLARYYGLMRTHTGEREAFSGSGWHFSKAEIGEKEYRRARAAVSRSARRLYERGLVLYVVHVLSGKPCGINLIDADYPVLDDATPCHRRLFAGLRRTGLPGTRVNKGKEKGRGLTAPTPSPLRPPGTLPT